MSPAGRRDKPRPAPVAGEVWFAVETDPVLPLHRIVFRHGSIDAQGGWFGGTRSRPRIEVARAPVPLLNNVIKNFWAAAWEPLAELPAYPSTDLGDKAPFSSGAAFALTLDAPQAVRAIRVIGSAAHVVTCRSLAACS